MNTKFLHFIALLVLITSCATNEIDTMTESSDKNYSESDLRINESEANEIGGNFLNQLFSNRATRGSIESTTEYVTNTNATRSGTESADTLAYIFNYGDNEGFAIISRYKRMFPVLAFSDTGRFSIENQEAYDQIQTYVSATIGSWSNRIDSIYQISSEGITGLNAKKPIVSINIDQLSPWNMYVDKEYPGCPVGCGPLAAGIAMSYSKNYITYLGTTYNLKNIVEAIYNGQNPTTDTSDSELEEMVGAPHDYTYSQAVSHMAKILYYIGQDLGAKYTTSGTSIYIENAYPFLLKYGFEIPSELSNFNLSNAYNYLQEDHILIMTGNSVEGGHAWIADGCYEIFQKNETNNGTTAVPYLHFNFGWTNGQCNGYYTGAIYEAIYTWHAYKYMAIKREWK